MIDEDEPTYPKMRRRGLLGKVLGWVLFLAVGLAAITGLVYWMMGMAG